MNRFEKVATLTLGYVLFLVVFLNVVLALGGSVQAWQLPVSYLFFASAVVTWQRWRQQPIPRWQWFVMFLAPVLLALIAYGMQFASDASWDGQDYQQSGVIALAQGWNPWHDANLPVELPAGSEYVRGYPKAIWLIQACIYKLTGQLQVATITNVIFAFIASGVVFAALRSLGLSRVWGGIITALAVLQIHALQQSTTFMADGYSYQLSLVAIAGIVLLIRERVKLWPLAIVCSAGLLMAGGKFSNLFICGLVALSTILYLWRSGLYRVHRIRLLVLGFAVIGALILWAPYGVNTVRYHSPVYPQNRPNESAKLRFDNVPNNLKHSSRPALLFYGIFSSTEPPGAGNPLSAQNVAELKIPFTFRRYEVHETNNFQGRVGSGGILFSGIIVSTLLVWLLLWRIRPALRTPHLMAGAAILSAAILVAALVLPVPNKLRYSPLVTFLPLIALTLLVAFQRQARWARICAIVVTVLVATNTGVAAVALVNGRVADSRAIRAQLATLRDSGGTYEVSVGSFYSQYQRLKDAGVQVRRVSKVSCAKPQYLQSSFSTTQLCRTD